MILLNFHDCDFRDWIYIRSLCAMWIYSKDLLPNTKTQKHVYIYYYALGINIVLFFVILDTRLGLIIYICL